MPVRQVSLNYEVDMVSIILGTRQHNDNALLVKGHEDQQHARCGPGYVTCRFPAGIEAGDRVFHYEDTVGTGAWYRNAILKQLGKCAGTVTFHRHCQYRTVAIGPFR